MSYQASCVLSPEKYINNLEDSANKDLFDPRQFTFDSTRFLEIGGFLAKR